MKKALIALAVVALLAVSAQAGEIKSHEWPCTFVSLEITSIPVVMDVGYWIKIKDQDKLKIKLVQDTTDLHKFTGCTTMKVQSNFNAALECSISKTGAVDGKYSCSLDPATVAPGETSVQVCAELKDAVLAAGSTTALAGQKDVQVATVKIKVKPV